MISTAPGFLKEKRFTQTCVYTLVTMRAGHMPSANDDQPFAGKRKEENDGLIS
jgi:hypothetical protein